MSKLKIILLGLSLITYYVLSAQSDAEGGRALLRGSIRDVQNKSRLSGSTVRVTGSTLFAVADVNGNFFLSLPAGNQKLLISYLGYTDTSISLVLQSGETRLLNIDLSSTSNELGGVEVTGFLQGQARALNQQKTADNIKNVISADQIGRFPDPNAAEALQRVPGVNIERDQGEGRYVLIRGLAPQFTNMNVNGEQIPSPEAGVRFVALDAIPSDQLASIEVSKSLTPDMDGDAVGGSVNLITRQANNQNLHINGSLAGGYNSLMKQPNIQGQLSADKRFGKKQKLGVLANANYYHNHLGSDNWERSVADNEVELRDYELVRTRLGLSSTIDYKFNNRNEIYLRGLYTRFTDREWRRRYVFIPEDDEIEKMTKDRFEAQTILSINMGGKHNFDKFYLNYEGQYSEGRQNTPYDHELGFIAGLPSDISFPNSKFPAISAPGFNDNANYEFNDVTYGGSTARDRNLTAKFEIGVPYAMKNSTGVFKFGGKVRLKEKSYHITEDVYESEGGVPDASAFDQNPVKDRFLGGRFDLGRPLYISSFNRFFNANPGLFELDVEGKAIAEAVESYQATEDVFAAFVMAKQQWNKLMVLGGVRYENTNVHYDSKDVIIDGAGDLAAITPVTGGTRYDFILPQLQLKYALSKFTNLRGAATLSYARPNFEEIVPAQEINVEDNEATLGNKELKPVSALNLDAMYEHYFGNVGIVSAGLFYKKLDDFIYRRVIFASPYPLTGTPIIESIDVIQSQNGNTANLVGLELAFQRKLNFLPGFFKNLSLYANYTYTDSKATIQSREADEDKPDEVEVITLPGQADHVGNFSLAYESKKFVIRAAVNFNGTYLSEVGGNKDEDLYVKNRAQVDLSASYVINKRFRLFSEFLNITNQPFETYQGNKNTFVQREFYGWWARLGVKFDLEKINRSK
jgi:TonB-dependent receptor